MGRHAAIGAGRLGPPENKTPRESRRGTRIGRNREARRLFDINHTIDADRKTFVKKGNTLMCGLNGDDEEAGRQMGDMRAPPSAASSWTGDFAQDLQTWKWSVVNPTSYSCKLTDHWKIPAVMKSLGLNDKAQSEGGDNLCYRIEHWSPNPKEDERQIPAINQWYIVDNIKYQATHSHYEFGVNFKGGAIFGFFLNSPINAASTTWYGGRKPADPAKLPKLRAFSEILWGYFFMLGISNDQTNQLIDMCLQKKGTTLQEWPGTKIDTSSDEGHALLGSPNGAAFAYFLMQHKMELGQKTITHVTIFRAETNDDTAFVDPHLVFHVGDVQKTDGGEEETVYEGMKMRSARTYKL